MLEDLNKTGLDIERTKLAAEDKEKNLVDNIGKTEREVRQEMDRKNAKSEKYWGNTYNGKFKPFLCNLKRLLFIVTF